VSAVTEGTLLAMGRERLYPGVWRPSRPRIVRPFGAGSRMRDFTVVGHIISGIAPALGRR